MPLTEMAEFCESQEITMGQAVREGAKNTTLIGKNSAFVLLFADCNTQKPFCSKLRTNRGEQTVETEHDIFDANTDQNA